MDMHVWKAEVLTCGFERVSRRPLSGLVTRVGVEDARWHNTPILQ